MRLFSKLLNEYVGNPNDKVIYARSSKRRSASFPTPRSLDRRHSLRLFGSSKRLQRCASTRSLSKNYAQTLASCGTDSSSSEYQSTDSSSPSMYTKILDDPLLSIMNLITFDICLYRKSIAAVTVIPTKWTNKTTTNWNVFRTISTGRMVQLESSSFA